MPFLSAFNWYGLIIGLAMAICIVCAYFTASRRGIDGDILISGAIICIPLAIVFARIYYVVFDLIDPNGQDWTFAKFIGIDDNGLSGLAIFGGLIGTAIGLFFLKLWRKRQKDPRNHVRYLQLLDLVFTFVILGQSIGRWGNFANQEAYGNLITNPALQWFPIGVFIDAKGAWYQATFFYESMWNLIGFGFLIWVYLNPKKLRSFDGFSFALYMIYEGIGRCWIEGLRSDSLWLVPGVIRISQLIAGLMIAFGVIYIGIHIYRAKKAKKKVFIFVKEELLCSDYFEYEKTKIYMPMPISKTGKELYGDYKFDPSEPDTRPVYEPGANKTKKAKISEKSEEPENVVTEKESVYEDKWDE